MGGHIFVIDRSSIGENYSLNLFLSDSCAENSEKKKKSKPRLVNTNSNIVSI